MTPAQVDADLVELGRLIISLDDDTRGAYLSQLDPGEWERVEQAITAAELEGADWHATPATMAHYLSNGEFRPYRYFLLMGEFIRDRFVAGDRIRAGIAEPAETPAGQIWIPAQMGKTSLVGNWTPVWALDRNPKLRIIYVSFDADKAVEEAGKARDIAEEHADQLRFRLRRDQRARGRWTTPEGGGLYAVGVYGGSSGWPADVLLIDDLFKGWVAAHSPTTRNLVWSIYTSQLRKRLQGRHCVRLYATTRWHEDDPPARMLDLQDADAKADRWVVLKLAARAEPPDPKAKHEVHRQPDPLGRQPGEVIEPGRFDETEVAARMAGSSYLANAQEMQRPTPQEGGEIKRAWFRIRDTMPARFDLEIASWDMKLKEKESGDFVAGGWWGKVGSAMWLGEVMRGQWNQPTTECAMALLKVRHPRIRLTYYENTGNGPEVVASLRRAHPNYEVSDEVAGELGMTLEEREKVNRVRRAGMSGLMPVTPRAAKDVRMRAVSGSIEDGSTYLVEAGWLDAYLDEMAAFGPNAAHDDQVDMTSQALSKLLQGQASATSAKGDTPKPKIDTRGGGTTGVTQGTPPPPTTPDQAARSGRVRSASRVVVPRRVPTSGR